MNLLFIDVSEEDIATSSENCPGKKVQGDYNDEPDADEDVMNDGDDYDKDQW